MASAKERKVVSPNISLVEDTDLESDSSESEDLLLSESLQKTVVNPVPKLKRENAMILEPPKHDPKQTSALEKNISEWTVKEVSAWAKDEFDEHIGEKFVAEEIDGSILLSSTIMTTDSMEKLGLLTIGKKGKFIEKLKQLKGECSSQIFPTSKTPLAALDRLLTNQEKDTLNKSDRSLYNTKKRKITMYIKSIWPTTTAPPKFRNNIENSQKLMKVVDELSSKDEFTLKRLGFGRNAIAQLIRKHMDERRRAQADLRHNRLPSTGTSDSSTDLTSDFDEAENSTPPAPPASKRSKQKAADSDDWKELTLSSAQTIMLCYLGKVSIQDIKLERELKPLAKRLGLSGLRNKDKNQFIKSISVCLLEKGLVSVNKPLNSVSSREDVTVEN